jgi:GNAT superfamily N-acetyltransferase
MEVGSAASEDVDAIVDTFQAARRAAMPWLPTLHSDAEDRRHFKERVVGECEVLVVRRDGLAVAFLALGNNMVKDLYVHPEVQRTGIGSALLEVAKRRRPHGLRLWVFQRNHGARAFYARHGFTEVEFTDGAGNEEREPDVLLAWAGPRSYESRRVRERKTS